jgi:diadenosine tetraphosphatase ApaH/serine/threonine PP2A family protein phosphatase
MRYAILADIHSNLEALQAVLADVEVKGGADEFWCVGDIVGYGPDPHACIELVQQRFAVCVAGNHDWAAIGKIDNSYFNPEAAGAAEWTSQQLKLEDIRYLESLPLTRESGDFTLAHGSPREPVWEYVLSIYEAQESLKYFKTRYCLVGHSHLPLLFECEQSSRVTTLGDGREIKLGDERLIINPGGTGQPRNGDSRSSYAICDTATGIVTLHRVKYDITLTQQKMREAGLPVGLIARLAEGQ